MFLDTVAIIALAISSVVVFVSSNEVSEEKIEAVSKDISDIERNAKSLELYLQDKKDHKDFCPQVKWDQPPLSTYKKTLKSHLPKDCKE